MGWNSQGYEIGNALGRGTFPAARLKRPGAPPSSQSEDFDPGAVRGSPIRGRAWYVALREFSGMAVAGSVKYIGPGLVKELSFLDTAATTANPMPDFALHYATSPYETLGDQSVGIVIPGTPLFDNSYLNDGGFGSGRAHSALIPSAAQSPNAFRLNYYIPDLEFFLALSLRNQTATALTINAFLLIYEQVLPSDFPGILA